MLTCPETHKFLGIWILGNNAGEMIAEWIVDKRPSLDLWPLDSRRFSFHHGTKSFMYPRAVEQYAYHYKMRYPGQEYQTSRELRLSPLYKILKDKGSVYGSKNGWERPLWFAPKGVEPIDQLDFLNPGWHKYVAEEHRSVREKVALIDQTSFGKFELFGKEPNQLRKLRKMKRDDQIRNILSNRFDREMLSLIHI